MVLARDAEAIPVDWDTNGFFATPDEALAAYELKLTCRTTTGRATYKGDERGRRLIFTPVVA